MTHDEICTYEVAKLAKKKGFNEECREFYCDDKSQKRITRISCNRRVTSFDYCSNSMLEDYYPPYEYCYIAAPTQSLLQRWIREEKGLCISVEAYPTLAIKGKVCFAWVAKSGSDGHFMKSNDSLLNFSTYELALEDALKYALENLI